MDSYKYTKPLQSHRFLATGLLASLVFLASCGGDVKKAPDPEGEHCVVALEKLSKDFTGVALIKARSWDVENIKNVSLTFDYTVPAEGTATPEETFRGLMVCRYEYSIKTRTTKGREAKAVAIRFRGRQLSLNELLLLNTSISGVKSRLQWPK